MYKIIDDAGAAYEQYVYVKESDFEKMIVSNADKIFGPTGIYFDIKRLIGTPKKGATIPDGYFLDLTFHNDPRLYLVEVELKSHDVYGHIGEQILRFGISTGTDKYKMKNSLLSEVNKDDEKKQKLAAYFSKSKYDNINELLDKVIFENKPAAIIVIDEATDELYNVMAQLTMSTEVIEAQTYVCGNKKLHRFSPFKDEVMTDLTPDIDADELDTIVVPAREEGFNEEFLKNNRWFEIRISSAMIDKIKYIAAYQVSPVSGITYVGEVDRIERYKDTNKYIVFFKPGTVKKINKVSLGTKKGMAPQAPRYSSYKKILEAKTLDELWG
ncbi:MAG: hypothetical protein HFE73_08485 [Firmicutes bacterium]|nr:hypothetical protein [Bacillota bacterium]